MRIAITGASGNVGTSLLRALRPDGHELVGIARRPPQTGSYAADVEWHAVDLAAEDSAAALADAFRGADAVVHLAWGFQPSHDEDYLERLGVGGTGRMLAAAAAAGVPHVVHMSSLGTYAPAEPGGREYADEDWPTTGVPTSMYSRHKAAAERLLDRFESEHPDVVLARVRPTLIGQRSAASGLMRYLLPAGVPHPATALVKVLPLDRGLRLQLLHADDVAAAYRLILDTRSGGAFNLASEQVLGPAELASAFGARAVHLPIGVLRSVVSTSWRLHLQQVDPGWIDLAWRLPLLDAGRARRELGWVPTHDARDVAREVVEGVRAASHDQTPALRRRTVRDGIWAALHDRPVAHRQRA